MDLLQGITHWGRVTHICVIKLSIIGSDNGLSPDRRQAIIWTNDGILLIGPLGANFNETFIGIHSFSCKRIHFKMTSGKWRPFFFGLNVLIGCNHGACGTSIYLNWNERGLIWKVFSCKIDTFDISVYLTWTWDTMKLYSTSHHST